MADENTNNDEKRSLKEEMMEDSATPDDIDDSKVKFLNGGKGVDDPHVVVEVGSGQSEESFTGLGKEELMQYAEDPFWVKIRLILFILFWVGWVAMLVAAIVIIVVAPKCPERPDIKWYQQEVIYQIFPKSFKDTTTDKNAEGAGVGDLKGISDKIGYLEGLGVKAFWLNSIYKSGGLYDGNDIVDHKNIDQVFGSLEEFKALRKVTKKKGMRMILDFIPNHTGKDHPWFVKSQNKEEDYEDYYVWADGKDGVAGKQPPNNWKTMYGTPAWTFDSTRKQWYLHQFLPELPDLNLRNSKVRGEVGAILDFWLDLGVDGFHINSVQHLVEHNDTSQDETTQWEYMKNQEDNLQLISEWRGILNKYNTKPGKERVMIVTVEGEEFENASQVYYDKGADIVPTLAFTDIDSAKMPCDATCLQQKIDQADTGNWRGWMLDNDVTSRLASRIIDAHQKLFSVLHLLLPGTPLVYYGDEISMKNGDVTGANVRDPVYNLTTGAVHRDNYRTPMLWTNGENAGFCDETITPWLPVNEDYQSDSVTFNNAHQVPYTILKSFKDLVELRSKESFIWGELTTGIMRDQIFYFTRKAEGFEGYLVAIFVGDEPSSYNFGSIAKEMTIVYHSAGSADRGNVLNTKDMEVGFTTTGEVYVLSYQ